MSCPTWNLPERSPRNANVSYPCSQIDCCKRAAEPGRASSIQPEDLKGLTVNDAIMQLLRFDLAAMLIVEAPREGICMDFASRIATDEKGNPVIEPMSMDIPF